MHGITCFSDSMCNPRRGVALELFGQKMAILSGAEHTMEFNEYFSEVEKRTGTPVEQHSSIFRNGKLSPYFQQFSPSQFDFQDPSTSDSIHSQHVFPYIRSKWENGSEDGCTSGHSVALKVSGFRCLFIFYVDGIGMREKLILGIFLPLLLLFLTA
ncbi:hypothetical protein CDAR_281561 [Caerostris darwini]|uniref:Uncharacterized protein n=1 Tax=Caerostris darwini TaxID=1538125 RepID=A0AAV4R133_9ARAC|nr:hypothetical protein CDAR_281561 [Caerostris darwini]